MTDLLFPPPTELAGAQRRYRIEEFLGRGGFGESYRARALDDGTEVTVKVLRLERLDSWKSLELFEREAEALGALSHPRIPRLVELFATDGTRTEALGQGLRVSAALEGWQAPRGVRVVLVQSYVAGRPLQRILDAGERLDPAATERLARDLLAILEYLHTRPQPVIHRDLKPSNVIIDDTGAAHLIDFGAIQNRIRGAAEAGSTMVGTFGYFPQEQILGRAVPSSDLYALGMTLLAALTGRPPEEQAVDAGTGKVQAPPGLPGPLARLLHVVLEPAPMARPATAVAARAILDAPYGAMVVATAQPLALAQQAQVPVLAESTVKWQRALYNTTLVGSGISAAAMYTLFFNQLSETMLVDLAPLWFGPLVFGIAGRIALPRQGALKKALAAAGIGVIGLLVFLVGIFPSL